MPNTSPQKTEFSTFVEETQVLFDRCVTLLKSKSNDYADGSDAFTNFKTAAQIAGISPHQTLLTLLGMKLSRLTQLIGKGKQAQHESVEDTLLDLINYIVLLRGMLKEQEGTSAPSPIAPSSVAAAPSSPSPAQGLDSYSQSAPNLLQQSDVSQLASFTP